jgi:1-phosphofructokinase
MGITRIVVMTVSYPAGRGRDTVLPTQILGTTPGMDEQGPSAFVFAPDPLLTVTIEAGAEGGDEIHLHAGGQGFWVGRLIAALGVPVSLCGPFGGETGRVARLLIEQAGLALRAVETAGSNGAYVHDRRGGERIRVADTGPHALSRHEVDELYGAALVGGLESTVCVLGGPGPWDPPILPADVYRRLAGDLRANGRLVVADLRGEPLDCALEGGLTVVKLSHDELVEEGRADDNTVEALLPAMARLRDSGADHVLVTRAEDPALVLAGDEIFEVVPPPLEAVDHRGAGDSMTAGLAAGMARGQDFEEALRLGAAAGGLNVTRRGLATGDRREIERLAAHIELRPWGSVTGGRATAERRSG